VGQGRRRPTAGPSKLALLAVDTRTPYLGSFDGSDPGKRAHYTLRWASTTDAQDRWSKMARPTIGA